MMPSQLSALANIISSGVQTLESAYAENGRTYPSLDDPFDPSGLDQDRVLVETRRLIVAAATQIIACVRPPAETVLESMAGACTTTTLGFIADTNVVDILKEAGPSGLHVRDLSARTGVDASYLARVLRFLATRHLFREITPNVFTNNRTSSVLISTKSMKEIEADPGTKYDAAPLASLVSSTADVTLKSMVHLSSFLQNPGTAAAPFNIAFETSAKRWDWQEKPGNEKQARRFAALMKAVGNQYPPEVFTTGLNGNALQPNDLVVDVGGGTGSLSLTLFNSFSHLRYVVQDLDKQIVEARKFWDAYAPDAIASGRVQLQIHDFMTPQPIKNAAVYFLRFIIHNWPDPEAKKILRNLRDAAGISSKLIIFDHRAIYSCESLSYDPNSVQKAPYPLLANLGVGGAGYATTLDIQMLSVLNGKERTEDEFKELGDATGWKLEKVTVGSVTAFAFKAT